jgi:hypothetical protein
LHSLRLNRIAQDQLYSPITDLDKLAMDKTAMHEKNKNFQIKCPSQKPNPIFPAASPSHNVVYEETNLQPLP